MSQQQPDRIFLFIQHTKISTLSRTTTFKIIEPTLILKAIFSAKADSRDAINSYPKKLKKYTQSK
jgi:hypothetical protein